MLAQLRERCEEAFDFSVDPALASRSNDHFNGESNHLDYEHITLAALSLWRQNSHLGRCGAG